MIKKICLLFVAAIFLTGCIKTETQITIKRNGTGFIEERIFVNSNVMNQNESIRLKADNKKQLATLSDDNKLIFKSFEKDGLYGIVGSRPVSDFMEADWNAQLKTQTLDIKTNNEDQRIISVKKGFFATKYKVNCEIKPRVTNAVKNTWVDISTIRQNNPKAAPLLENPVKISGFYNIKIPTRAYKHNSTNVDTRRLVYKWELKEGVYTPIRLEFAVFNIVNFLTTLVILLIVLAEILYFYGNGNKKRKNNNVRIKKRNK